MWRVALADMRFRLRRFVITVLATAVVFSMTLLMTGVSAALHHQNRTIVESFDGDHWFVASGAAGPFTAPTPVPASVAEEVAALPGVTRATPVVLFRSVLLDDDQSDVNVIAVPPDGLGVPELADGHQPETPGEVVVDTALESDIGDTVNIGGHLMVVSGTAKDVSYFFGTPTVYMSLADAQEQYFGFLPLASAIVARGEPGGDVPGLTVLTVEEVRADLRRPMLRSDQTIQFINLLLWIAAVGIVGSIVYLSTIERVREFAIMKAAGASNVSLLSGLALQAVVLSVLAAAVAAGFANLMAPGFPFAVRVTGASYLVLTAVALAVGVAASFVGLRRAVAVDPALAFGGS